jgi:hypothetical protein
MSRGVFSVELWQKMKGAMMMMMMLTMITLKIGSHHHPTRLYIGIQRRFERTMPMRKASRYRRFQRMARKHFSS